MTNAIPIPPGEHGRIRVFAINIPSAQMKTDLQKHPKADVARTLLEDPHLDTTNCEIFPVSDLSGMGLTTYLIEGYVVPEAEIAPDRTRLEALEGYVLLLFSDAFGGDARELTVGPDLTLIGTYGEFQPVKPGKPLTAKSASAYSGVPPNSEPYNRVRGASNNIVFGILVMLVLAGIWWVFG